MQLRDYQAAAYNEWVRLWQTHKNIMVVMSTGLGKTVLFGHAIANYPGAVCAIAHRQELVSQISVALANYGVRHRIIGPQSVARACATLHMNELKRSYYDPHAKVAVAGVDTLVRRDAEKDSWFKQVGLVVQDECFPAGTLIDGKPIERIRVGDFVLAYDESSNALVPKQVVRTFKNIAPKNMVSVRSAHHVVDCTSEHPFFTRRGWVPAKELTSDDYVLLHSVQKTSSRHERSAALSLPEDRIDFLQQQDLRIRLQNGEPEGTTASGEAQGDVPYVRRDRRPEWSSALTVETDGTSVLQSRMLSCVSSETIKRNDEQDQSRLCVRPHEAQQPDAACRDTRPYVRHSSNHRPSTEGERRQREDSASSGTNAGIDVRKFGVHSSTRDQNGVEEGQRHLSGRLQTRPREPDAENCDRGRRKFALAIGPEEAGSEERRILAWSRVDGIEIFQSRNPDGTYARSGDGHVYNFEVADLHTYVANGFVVHNCHHVLRDNKWGRASLMFPNAHTLGVTATPIRADGKGLGAHADGIFEHMIEGPPMRESIQRGFLTEYRVFAPRVSDLDLSAVPISEGGDYSPEKLRKAVHKSRIVGDVVQHYLRIAPGKLGVTFAVDVESAREIVQAYRAANVTAELVTAETPDLLRAQILRRFRDREVMQLVNVDLFGEGFNLPAIEVVAMARPTQSFSLFAQQFGRALRPLPGKTHAIIIDHVGNVERHGLPDKKREWTLDRRERRNSSGPSDLIPMTVCIQCTSAYERYRGACPYCGFVREPAGRGAPEFVDGVLEELDPMVLARMRGEIDPPLKFPVGATGPIRARLTATHAERVEAQRKLRIATGVWGALKEREGLTVAEGQRTFYFRYGIDLMSAWALNASDADKLRAHIEAEIGVVPT